VHLSPAARLLVAAWASVVLLAGCGGGDDEADESGPDTGTPSPSVTAAADPKALNACRTAMISALSKAYDASREAPAAERDQVFIEQAGQLPEECRLIDASELKRLKDEATGIAIPPGS
jgi:hypothetical protein